MEDKDLRKLSKFLTDPPDVELDYEASPQKKKGLAPAEPSPRHSNRPSPTLQSAEDLSLPAEARHSRKCQICSHPERDMIEEDFVLWRTPRAMVREYALQERSLYRHAHAFGLFRLRRENMRLALDRVIERGAHVQNTGDTIIRAVRAQACLTDDNRWVEPTKRVTFCTEPAPEPVTAPPILIPNSPTPPASANEAEDGAPTETLTATASFLDPDFNPDTNDEGQSPYQGADSLPTGNRGLASESRPPSFVGPGFSPDIIDERESPHRCADLPATSNRGLASEPRPPSFVGPGFSPDINDEREAQYRCADLPATSIRGPAFEASPDPEAEILIDSLAIRNAP